MRFHFMVSHGIWLLSVVVPLLSCGSSMAAEIDWAAVDPLKTIDDAIEHTLDAYNTSDSAKGLLPTGEASNPMFIVRDHASNSEVDLDQIKNLIALGVKSMDRNVDALKISYKSVALKKSGVTHIQSALPISEQDTRRDQIVLNVWICPDSKTAAALFLHRAGRQLLKNGDLYKVDIIDERSKFLDSVLPFQRAYWFKYARNMSLPPVAKDSEAVLDRVGIVRHNLVIEVCASTNIYNQQEKKWISAGITGSDLKRAIFWFLDSVDAYLVKKSTEVK